MPTQRQERVNNLLQYEISEIVRREMQDPRLGFLTITGVAVSVDLRYADVFVSVLGTKKESSDTLKALTRARGFIRSHLGPRLDLRYTPELRFKLDQTAVHAQHIEQLLKQQAASAGDDKELHGDGQHH